MKDKIGKKSNRLVWSKQFSLLGGRRRVMTSGFARLGLDEPPTGRMDNERALSMRVLDLRGATVAPIKARPPGAPYRVAQAVLVLLQDLPDRETRAHCY